MEACLDANRRYFEKENVKVWPRKVRMPGINKNEKIKIFYFFQTFFLFSSINLYSIYTVGQKLLQMGHRKWASPEDFFCSFFRKYWFSEKIV